MKMRRKLLQQEDFTILTKAYLLIWCISWSLPLCNLLFLNPGVAGGLDERPLIQLDYRILLPMIVLLLCILLYTTTTTTTTTTIMESWIVPIALVTHVVDLAIRWLRLPYVWDHEFWACMVEIAFVAIYGIHYFSKLSLPSDIEACFLTTFRRQFSMFYFAATFWKINTSFLNTQTSCGTVLILELVGTYFPPMTITMISMLAKLSPYITLLTEALIGILMLLASERSQFGFYRYASIIIGTCFHLSIFLLPVNGAGGFSMDCVRHFILFFESDEINHFFIQSKQSSLSKRLFPISFGIFWYALVTASIIRLRYDCIGQGFDFAFFGLCQLLCLYVHLTIVSVGVKSTKPDYAKLQKPPIRTNTQSILLQFISALVLFLSFCYAYIGPILGIQQMGAPTMYSNLRYFDGGNHLLVPTSILPNDIIYGGQLVKVVHSTCPSLNQRFAYIDSTVVFPLKPLRYLTSVLDPSPVYQLFPLCMSNPHSRAVLQEAYNQSNPPASGTFAPFVIPISEVRQALHEASTVPMDAPYTVVLANVEKGSFPEMYVVLDNEGGCSITTSMGDILTDTCATNPLARALLKQSFVDETATLLLGSLWLAQFFQYLTVKLLKPYPQLEGWSEKICMS